MSAIKAIETYYKGCHFRSRLEARWAVFFDCIGIEWSYELEGFEWPARPAGPDDGFNGNPELFGGHYLPDFWLPSIETWFEVKGGEPSREDLRILSEFDEVNDKRLVVAVGDIPHKTDLMGVPKELGYEEAWTGLCIPGDQQYAWCSCPWCGKFGIEYNARGARVCAFEDHSDLWHDPKEDKLHRFVKPGSSIYYDKAYSGDDPRILWAYDEARSARFEHGQSGRRR